MYLCTYADCRVPHERHGKCAAQGLGKCWDGVFSSAIGVLQHQHVPKRSQGGKECPVMLCAGHHDAIDNGVRYEGLRIADRVHDVIAWGGGRDQARRIYEIYLRGDGSVLRSILLEEPDAEGGEHQSSNLVNDEATEVPSSPPSVPGTSD